MDRNGAIGIPISGHLVALRKESVDRNIGVGTTRARRGVSLSARRAWIEIEIPVGWWKMQTVAHRKESVDRNVKPLRELLARGTVALRKESVDRNAAAAEIIRRVAASLSARRAWIEIRICCRTGNRAESRSPQGERG